MMSPQKKLKELATYSCDKIRFAREGLEFFKSPFKHLVIDDFLSDDLARGCLKNFPDVKDQGWEHSNDEDIEIKYRTNWKSEFDIPDGIVDAVRILNSSIFLLAVSQVMGIQKIIPDPYFSGGGLNITARGGLLDVHVDGNYHDPTGLSRRLNAIVYLNPDWEASWGGEFGLYDEKGESCLKKIPPIFNRLIVFDTHDKSFHGLPDPVNFPEDKPRRSIITYYYTKESRPEAQVLVDRPHSALWKKRNFLDKRGNRERDYY